MSKTSVGKPGIREELTQKRIIVLAVTFLAATFLTVFGLSKGCFGAFLIGIGLYMVPHLSGVSNVKLLTAYGAVFFVTVVLIGTVAMAPAAIGSNDTPQDRTVSGITYSNVEYNYVGNDVIISANVKGVTEGHDVIFRTFEVIGVGYVADQTAVNNPKDWPMVTVINADGSRSVSLTLQLDKNKLHAGVLNVTKTDGGSEVYNKDTASYLVFMTGAYSGSLTEVCLYGVFVSTSFVMVLFFMVLFMSAFMRSRIEKTRAKMEAEGRLYPKGYGRCESCGNLVLPGEVNCRKCGKYIDRPDEMKPKKADYFTCSDCGAEVPSDAVSCPRCGVHFDEDDEIEVIRADGTSEITTEISNCPECGMEVPVTATFCPKCGATFKK